MEGLMKIVVMHDSINTQHQSNLNTQNIKNI